MKRTLLMEIGVVAEVTGSELSESAIKMIERELKKFPEDQAFKALDKTARKTRGRLTLAEILSNIDDGRPTADEAWSYVPKTEQETIVWNQEISEAWSCCHDLIYGDKVAARMAFKAAYDRIVDRNRSEGIIPVWEASLGFDPTGREQPIRKAIEQGRLDYRMARHLLPPEQFEAICAEKGQPSRIEYGG